MLILVVIILFVVLIIQEIISKLLLVINCVTEMLIELMDLSEKCIEEMRQNEDMKLNKEDKINFKNADKCYICEGSFERKENIQK
jgi:tRNA U54 and U55 pseudouridine synthase Pus10